MAATCTRARCENNFRLSRCAGDVPRGRGARRATAGDDSERPGELWFDGLSARATRSMAVEEKGMRLFLLDQPETGMPRGWKRKQPRIKS